MVVGVNRRSAGHLTRHKETADPYPARSQLIRNHPSWCTTTVHHCQVSPESGWEISNTIFTLSINHLLVANEKNK